MKSVVRSAVFVVILCTGQLSWADLGTLFVGAVGTPLEQNAARANQAVFDVLDAEVTAGTLTPVSDPQRFAVYENTRELVHTANELQGGPGDTTFSLGLDLEGLGFALRWTAAEEMAAHESLTSETANGQLANLAGRLSALRFGAGGFSLAGLGFAPSATLVDNEFEGSEVDNWTDSVSRLGGFINGSFGYGGKDPTAVEPAFDFDNSEYMIGLDYRLRRFLVVGAAYGITDAEIDFDSTQSIVDGGVKSDARLYSFYGLFANERFYVDGVVSLQKSDLDITRRIVYPSFNPDVPGTDETALSSTEANTFTASFSAGVHWQNRRFGIEPFIDYFYQDIEIDGFRERGTTREGFDLNIGKQTYDVRDLSLGVHLTATFTPSIAVIVPYIRAEWHNESGNSVRRVSAVYANGPASNSTDFLVPTDRPDDSYYTVMIGFSSVLRGSRIVREGGRSKGGLQAFVQYQSVFDLDDYDNNVITGGFRYEF